MAARLVFVRQWSRAGSRLPCASLTSIRYRGISTETGNGKSIKNLYQKEPNSIDEIIGDLKKHSSSSITTDKNIRNDLGSTSTLFSPSLKADRSMKSKKNHSASSTLSNLIIPVPVRRAPSRAELFNLPKSLFEKNKILRKDRLGVKKASEEKSQAESIANLMSTVQNSESEKLRIQEEEKEKRNSTKELENESKKRPNLVFNPVAPKEVSNRKERKFRQRLKISLPKEVIVPNMITLREFSRKLTVSIKEVSKILKRELDRAEIDPCEYLDFETCELVGVDLGVSIKEKDKRDRLPSTVPKERSHLARKPPVVCVMGHVNHGKTSLLDVLRNTRIVDKEDGGITQTVGGFIVKGPDGEDMCFLDTPGHSVFRGMRDKGCRATDIVVLIVSATDGVQEQTVESIELAQEHGVPMIVAINKCDVDGVDIDAIKQQLLESNVVVEDLGGETICIEISARSGKGVNDLLEAVMVQAESDNLRADLKAPGEMVVLEKSFTKAKGVVMTGVVTWGTLKVGDTFVCGKEYGKVREIVDGFEKKIKKAPAGTPVAISGLRGEGENAGGEILAVKNEKTAKDIVEYRVSQVAYEAIYKARSDVYETLRQARGMKIRPNMPDLSTKKDIRRKRVRAGDETIDDAKEQDDHTVYAMVRADTQGSLDAIMGYVDILPTKHVQLKILNAAVGPPTVSDFQTLELINGGNMILFNTKASNPVLKKANELKIPVTGYKVIYDCMDRICELLTDRMPTTSSAKITGVGEFIAAVKLSRGRSDTVVAGVKVRSGTLRRDAKWQVIRDGECVFEAKSAASMRHFKEDVNEMPKGEECGVVLEGFDDYKKDDILHCIEIVKEKIPFDDSAARRMMATDTGKNFEYK